MLLLYSPLNSYLYVHWILDLNKYYYYYFQNLLRNSSVGVNKCSVACFLILWVVLSGGVACGTIVDSMISGSNFGIQLRFIN